MRIQIKENSIKLWLSEDNTTEWVHKSKAQGKWFDSVLLSKRLFAEFNSKGLCRLTINGRFVSLTGKISDEAKAMTSDWLQVHLSKDHPLYFITVGQFNPQTRSE